jgi:hypothetical protein
MDVPCPKCSSTDLKKVSLSCEEGRYCPSKRSIVQILVATAGSKSAGASKIVWQVELIGLNHEIE